jgi:hypothetical protein
MGGNHQEGLVSAWANGQQKVLEDWLDLMQGMDRPSQAATWNETVKAWQTAVQETLDAQARWLRDWTERIQFTSGSPTVLRKNVQQAQVLLLRWTEAQQQLWRGWFHLVQHLGSLIEADFQIDERLLSRLQESGQAMIKGQTDWVRLWSADVLDQ